LLHRRPRITCTSPPIISPIGLKCEVEQIATRIVISWIILPYCLAVAERMEGRFLPQRPRSRRQRAWGFADLCRRPRRFPASSSGEIAAQVLCQARDCTRVAHQTRALAISAYRLRRVKQGRDCAVVLTVVSERCPLLLPSALGPRCGPRFAGDGWSPGAQTPNRECLWGRSNSDSRAGARGNLVNMSKQIGGILVDADRTAILQLV
jgi:hypothetical protein